MELERRNAYFCKSCRKVTITVDVNEGVTPMFILCPDCKKEHATSLMYQIPGCMRFDMIKGIGSILPAEYEWYTPEASEIKKLSSMEKEHVKKGGLMMRKRTDAKVIMIDINKNK